MKPLYEIDMELQQVILEAEVEAIENEGEISDIIADKLGELQQDRDIKIGNICRYIKSLDAEAKMVKAEAKKLSDRARATENKSASMKTYLSNFLPAGEKFTDENSKISWRKSESLLIGEVADIPEKYQRVTIAYDKTELKKDIKSGVEFAGVKLIEKQNIQIK